jgi:hypothetical protein
MGVKVFLLSAESPSLGAAAGRAAGREEMMIKQRKPQVFTRETVRVTPKMAREVLNAPWVRAWEGCTNTKKGYDLPPEWVNLIVYWSPKPRPDLTLGEIVMSPFCTRDAVLCGKHARELEALLKPLAARELDTPAGEAD